MTWVVSQAVCGQLLFSFYCKDVTVFVLNRALCEHMHIVEVVVFIAKALFYVRLVLPSVVVTSVG